MSEPKKPLKVIFEPGCFDQLDDMTQEEIDELTASIEEMFASDDFMSKVVVLSEEEAAEIYAMMENTPKNTRH